MRTGNIKTTDTVPEIDLPLHGAPPWWEHQRRAFHFARDLDAAGIYIGMGGGKSRVVVDLVRDRGDQRVLILCPKNVIGVWPKQFELYAPGEYRMITPTKGTVAKRAEEIRRQLSHVDGPAVVIVNYDSAWRPKMNDLLLSLVWDRVVLDESHRVKSAGGKASRYVARLRRVARRRLCLTGTPMPHSPLDVYGQYRFLDPRIFGTNFTVFRNRYAIMGGYPIERWNPATRRMEIQGAEIIGWHNEPELAARTYSIAYRIADEELDAILGLEEPIHEVREVELRPATMTLYKRLYEDFCADVGSGVVSFDNALVRLLRLAQVTSGHLPVTTVEGETAVEIVDTAKADALRELLEDIPPGALLRVHVGRLQPRRLRAGAEAHAPARPDAARRLLPPRGERHGRRRHVHGAARAARRRRVHPRARIMILRLVMLAALVVLVVVTARAERRRQERAQLDAMVAAMSESFAEMSVFIGETLTPAFASLTAATRRVVETFTALGDELVGSLYEEEGH
jgi:hypothetical protein